MADADRSDQIEGVAMPTWLIKFDKNGTLNSPDTQAAALAAVSGHSHVVFMSHGWNTDFADAVGQYTRFLQNFETVARGRMPAAFNPVFIGVYWPSVWFPIDKGPALAAFGADDVQLRAIAAAVAAPGQKARLQDLMSRPRLGADEAAEAVSLALDSLRRADTSDLIPQADLDPKDVLRSALDIQRASASETEDDDELPRDIDAPAAAAKVDAAIAGNIDLNPIHLARLFSLYEMKDRAGKVGANGVADLLRKLVAVGRPVHLVGHSFGCKVVLSALAVGPAPSPVPESALLLEPAISYLCFAETVPGRTGPGGYRRVLTEKRVKRIFVTYSRGDFPLHDIFHLALRREVDLGDALIAPAADDTAGNPPSRYCALGGYGPRGSGERLISPIPKPYDRVATDSPTLVAFDGSASVDYPAPSSARRIASHGDVASPYTAWALVQQMGG